MYINYNLNEIDNNLNIIFICFMPLLFCLYLLFFLTSQKSELMPQSYTKINNKQLNTTRVHGFILMLLTVLYIYVKIFKYVPEMKIILNSVGVQFNGKIFVFQMLLIVLFCILSYLTLEYRTDLRKEHILLLWFFVFAALNVVIQTNLMGIFLIIEMFSLASYIIVASIGNKRSVEGGLKYALMGMISSVIMIMSLLFLLLNFGTLNILEISLLDNYNYITNNNNFFVVFCCILFLIALFFKLAIVPFHQWIVDVYKSASNVSFLWLVSTTKVVLFFLCLIIFESLLQNTSELFKYIFAIAGVLSLIIGNIGGLIQTNFKGLFAYSSIVTAGFLIVTFISYFKDPQTASALGLLYLIIYLFNILSFFFFLSKVQQKSLLFGDLRYINNIIKVDKLVGFGLIINFFSFLGLPPFLGFIPKVLIFYNLYQENFMITCVLFIFLSLIGAFYYFKVIKRISLFQKSEITIQETFNILNVRSFNFIEKIIAIFIIFLNIFLIIKIDTIFWFIHSLI